MKPAAGAAPAASARAGPGRAASRRAGSAEPQAGAAQRRTLLILHPGTSTLGRDAFCHRLAREKVGQETNKKQTNKHTHSTNTVCA